NTLALTAAGSNTLIIIVGDNGTLGYSVNLPFDPTRAKGQVYQTGVQVPLLIAGAGVGDPGFARAGLTSIIDIYGTILDAAGLSLPQDGSPFAPVS
ncbi:MAG: sulfatase-like hydrolase/transferase, partial [Betaproteobacteria bacterium]